MSADVGKQTGEGGEAMSELRMVSIGKDEAIRLAGTGWWKGLEPAEVFSRQMQTRELMMNFGDFHESAEKALGRSVWTHEFARPQKLWEEFCGERTVTDPLMTSLETLSDILSGKDAHAEEVPDEEQ